MNKFLLFITISLLSSSAFGQFSPLYHQVKIITGENGLKQLAQAGVAVDHGDFKKGYSFTSDFSDAELKIIKESGLPYEVLIEDVSSYYVNRNKQQHSEKPYGAEGCDVCDVYETPLNFQLGTMGGFYKYQELLNALDSMRSKYPNLITTKQPLSQTLTTIEGRPVFFVKISDNPTVDENEPEVMYSAVHHAREAESLSQLIFYMWYLLENYNSNSYVKYLVDHTEMYFVPCLNPDGYIYNQTTNPNGGGMWRKNRRNNGDGTFGVDLNRNYGEFWGFDNQGSSPDGNNETYRGTAAFSEPETQMMRNFCNAHSFKMALNAHTFSNLLIYPYGHVPSLETSDSMTFRHFAKDMASCSGFLTGTGDETVGYVTNGDSDDWMYGEQTSKPKIISMTPEAGRPDDGFWPTIQRIIPIAKQTVDQNLDVAKLATPYAEVVGTDAPFVQGGTGYMHFNFQRVGLGSSNFSVALIPVSSNIAFGNSRTFNTPIQLQSYADSISYSMPGTAASGDLVKFVIKWENADGFVHNDTIEKYIGVPEVVFSNDGSSMAGLESTTGWGVSNGSITDSPNGNYAANSNSSVTTVNQIDLENATAAYLSFNGKWDIERGFDDVTVEAAAGSGSYNILCGRFNHLGNENQNSRKAVYDGIQSQQVQEYIDLKDYLGQKIKIRFTLHSDPGLEKDGFYFDNMKVLKFTGGNVGIGDVGNVGIALQNVPNPCSRNTTVIYDLPNDRVAYYLKVIDQTGREIFRKKLDHQVQEVKLDLQSFVEGMYFYTIVSDEGRSSVTKKMVILK